MKNVKSALAILLALLCVCSCTVLAESGGWTCPDCGRVNDADANFCGSCRGMKPETTFTVESLANARMCPRCGKIGPMTDSFCTNCGSDYASLYPDALLAEKRELLSTGFAPEGAFVLRGSMNSDGQTDTYRFTAEADGKYGFYLTEAKSGLKVRYSVYDAQGYKVCSGTAGRGDGETDALKAGTEYTVQLKQYSETGDYVFTVYKAAPVADITGFTYISDSIRFRHQDNVYEYAAAADGTYRIYLKEADSGFSLSFAVNDSQGYRIDSGVNRSRNDGLSVSLQADEVYYIHASQYSDTGDYVMAVMSAKEPLDISGCQAVGDEIAFKNESIRYTYTAPADGQYRFALRFMKKGVTCSIAVYDQNGYTIGSSINLGAGDALKCKLEAGRTYSVVVKQYNDLGSFTLGIDY